MQKEGEALQTTELMTEGEAKVREKEEEIPSSQTERSCQSPMYLSVCPHLQRQFTFLGNKIYF